MSYECAHCGAEHAPERTVDGSYCSADCSQAARRIRAADHAIHQLAVDRRFCSTCFRQIRETAIPADRWGACDAFGGDEFRTRHARTVWTDRKGAQRVGTGCVCGNCRHTHGDLTIRDIEAAELAEHIQSGIALLDGLELTVDAEDLRAELDDLGVGNVDVALANAISIP